MRFRNTKSHPAIEYLLTLALVALVVLGGLYALDYHFGRFLRPPAPTVVDDSMHLQQTIEATDKIYHNLSALEKFESGELEPALGLLILLQTELGTLQEKEKVR